MGSSLRSEGAALMKPNRGFLGLSIFAYAMAIPVLALVAATGIYPLLVLLVHCGLFGTMALSYAVHSPKHARFESGTLRVEDSAISMNGKVLATRAELTQGFLVPTEGKLLVRLERKSASTLYVQVKDEEEGHRVLEALGFEASQRAAKMRLATGLLAMPIWKQMLLMMTPVALLVPAAFIAALALGNQSLPFILAGVFALITYMFAMAFVPQHISIGTDGLVTSWFGKKRYIAFSEVERVEQFDEFIGGKQQRGVRLHLRSSEKVLLPTGQLAIGKNEASRLAARIEDARAARRAGADHPADLLVRGDRAPIDWVRVLRRLGAGAHAPRTAAIPHDTLVTLVEDSAAPAVDRASAAVAALASEDPEIQRRVRVAAETTASPKLRIALGRIAADPTNEEAIATALEGLEEPPEEPFDKRSSIR